MNAFSTHSDLDIFRLFKQGNTGAYDELYNRYWEKLYNYTFHRSQSKDTAFDIVQEIFASLWTRKESIEIQTSLSGYLFSTARILMIHHVRRTKLKEQYLKDYVLFTNSPQNYAEQSVLAEDLQNALNRSIDQLPPKCREITRLSLLENWSVERIAQKLNISSRTVENQLSIGRQRLRESLAEYTVLLLLLNKLL